MRRAIVPVEDALVLGAKPDNLIAHGANVS